MYFNSDFYRIKISPIIFIIYIVIGTSMNFNILIISFFQLLSRLQRRSSSVESQSSGDSHSRGGHRRRSHSHSHRRHSRHSDCESELSRGSDTRSGHRKHRRKHRSSRSSRYSFSLLVPFYIEQLHILYSIVNEELLKREKKNLLTVSISLVIHVCCRILKQLSYIYMLYARNY